MERTDQNDRPPTPGVEIGDIAADDLFAAADNIDSSARPVRDDNAAFERDVDAEFRRLVEEQRQRDAQRAAANRRRRVEAAARARFDRYQIEQSRAPSTANGTAHAAVNNADLGRGREGGWGRLSPRFPGEQRPRRLSPVNNADLGRGREGGWGRMSPRFPGDQPRKRLSPVNNADVDRDRAGGQGRMPPIPLEDQLRRPLSPQPPRSPLTPISYPVREAPGLFESFFGFSPSYQRDSMQSINSSWRQRSGGRHPFEYEP